MPEVLITGGGGQLGMALQRARWPGGWHAVALDRRRLDLGDPQAIHAALAARPWAAVVNAGAYTAVDRAEGDAVAAWRINALAPAALAQGCHALDVPLIQVSTDYVFDGSRTGAWEVDDPTAPLNVYGASKLGGELAVRASAPRHAIVRTAWIVGPTGSNFVKTMLKAGAERDELRIVADQRGAPTSAADLADALVTIGVRLATDREAPTGTFHFSNAGETTWFDFAREIFAQAAPEGRPAPALTPVSSGDYPTAARRPANSVLSHRAITAAFGIAPRPWQAALRDIMTELA